MRSALPSAFLAVGIACSLGFSAVLASCSRAPATPSPVIGSTPVPTGNQDPVGSQLPGGNPPPGNPQAGYHLSGIVFETIGNERRPISGGRVYYWVGPYEGFGGHVRIDTIGGYIIPNLPDRQRIRVTAHADHTGGDLVQQRAANTLMNADTKLDIELGPPGISGLGCRPRLSGVVTQRTSEGERPVSSTPVVYYSIFRVPFDVYTRTDSTGRYEFCGISLGSGELLAGDCNDAMQRTSVEIRGDAEIDVDLTSWIKNCP